MVVKFFGNKKGGSSKAIDYLLNEREAQGTAKVLHGDPQLTKDLINSIQHKQKVTVGCLSFEEKNISQEQKIELMRDFENHLLPGMQDRYNILWVEHTDKGRLELNFVIPKIDLETQKSLNPYYHKADLPRVEKWQDLQNLKYNYSSPKDPSKKRTLETDPKQIGLSKDYEQLDKLLHNLTLEGKINNREQLIELCEANNITITRKNKDYLSLKLPDSQKAKKFKGSIYSEEFTSIGAVREISSRAREEVKQYNSRDTQRELERLNAELKSYTQTKEREYRQKYPTVRERTENKNRKIEREFNRDTQEQTPKYRGIDKRETGAREQSQSNINGDSNIHNNSNIDNRVNNVNSEQATQQRRFDNLSYNKEAINDSTRTSINARTPTRERLEYQTYLKSRKPRSELLADIEKKSRTIREQHLENSKQLREEYANNTRDLQQRVRIIENEHKQVVRESENHLQQIENLEHKSYGYTKLREFGKKLKDIIVDTREWIKDKISLIGDYYKKDFKYKSEPLEKEIKEIKVKKLLGREITVKEVKNLEGVYAKESLLDTIKQEKERTKQRDNSRGHYQSR